MFKLYQKTELPRYTALRAAKRNILGALSGHDTTIKLPYNVFLLRQEQFKNHTCNMFEAVNHREK